MGWMVLTAEFNFMKKYDYTKSSLTDKYQVLTERYFVEIKKEDLAEGCWDEETQHPVSHCFNEDGTLKEECKRGYEQSVMEEPTGDVNNSGNIGAAGPNADFGGTQQGQSLAEEEKEPSPHLSLLKQHLHFAEECGHGWAADSNHPHAPLVLEAIRHLRECIEECDY